MIPLQPVELPYSLEISSAAFVFKSELGCKPTILIVKHAGLYHPGSPGSADASYMNAVIKAAIYSYASDGLVLDYSELDYIWGDNLEHVLPGDESLYPLYGKTLPTAVFLGSQCREAIRTLTFGINDKRPLSEIPWATESLDSAIAQVEARVAESTTG